jgi:malonyl-CoA decarboxylase
LKREAVETKLEAPADALLKTLSDVHFMEDRALAKRLSRPLREIAYLYLTKEKNAMGKPLNPVAGFHFGNWARLAPKNVHFGANRTERGIRDSLGVMVSYVYSSTWLHELRRSARAMFPWDS